MRLSSSAICVVTEYALTDGAGKGKVTIKEGTSLGVEYDGMK